MGQILNKLMRTKTNFNDLPPEMKDYILSYLCDSNAFTAASVCKEWKKMLGSRFEEVDTVTIGERMCTAGDHRKYGCNESNDCANGSKHLSAEVMLKASAHLELNVRLKISHPSAVTELDSKVVIKGLLSVSRFTLSGRDTLSFNQLDDLFKGLEKGDKIMEDVKLSRLDLTKLNQDRLVRCIVDKMKSLALIGGFNFPLKLETVKQLLNNIITRPVQLKSLFFYDSYYYDSYYYDFSTLINTEDLKKLIAKMTKIHLRGTFTSEQIEAVKSLPDVEINGPFV